MFGVSTLNCAEEAVPIQVAGHTVEGHHQLTAPPKHKVRNRCYSFNVAGHVPTSLQREVGLTSLHPSQPQEGLKAPAVAQMWQ